MVSIIRLNSVALRCVSQTFQPSPEAYAMTSQIPPCQKYSFSVSHQHCALLPGYFKEQPSVCGLLYNYSFMLIILYAKLETFVYDNLGFVCVCEGLCTYMCVYVYMCVFGGLWMCM